MNNAKLERYQQRRADLAKAATRFAEALAQPENEFIRDSIVQRFEFTFEQAWKTIKLWLESKSVIARNPRDVLQEALQNHVIIDGIGWSALLEMRNLTSHVYSEEDVIAAYIKIRAIAPALFQDLLKALPENIL